VEHTSSFPSLGQEDVGLLPFNISEDFSGMMSLTEAQSKSFQEA